MKSKFALVESPALKHAKFSIMPMIRKGNPNMGLTNENMVLHEGINHTDIVGCKADGRIKTYFTGLNENTAAVQNLPLEQKEAKIAAIRKLIARAEREIEGNYKVADPDTKEIDKVKDFWEHVTIFKSVIPDVFDNRGVRVSTYWDTLELKLNNLGIILDENSVKDLIIMEVIEAGGFCMVAPSYEAALQNSGFKFYLNKTQVTATVKIADHITRDRAATKLLALMEKDTNKLFYITKLITVDSLYFKTGKNSTPMDIYYDECHRFIDGETPAESSKTSACEQFLAFEKMKLDELKARCMIRDGKALHIILFKESELYYPKTDTILGRNSDEAALFLMNPGNLKTYNAIFAQVQKEWEN